MDVGDGRRIFERIGEPTGVSAIECATHESLFEYGGESFRVR